MKVNVLLLFIVSLFLLSGRVRAEGECPPGMFPTNPPGTQGPVGCAPIPGYDQQQASRSPSERWIDHWGAIATDFAHGSAGASLDKESRGSAEKAALANCQSNGGLSCKIEISYVNECAAMVVGDSGHNTAPGATLNEAIQKGIKICTDSGDHHCRAYYSSCSLPQRIQ